MKHITTKYKLPSKNKMPHIGQLLQQYIKKHHVNSAQLARSLGRAPITISAYKKNESIQAGILYELCHALQYNFFAEIAHTLPIQFANNVPYSNQHELAIDALNQNLLALQHQLELVTAERDILLKAVQRN